MKFGMSRFVDRWGMRIVRGNQQIQEAEVRKIARPQETECMTTSVHKANDARRTGEGVGYEAVM